jgi:hypothetical protein
MNHVSETELAERLLRDARWAGLDSYPATAEFRVELGKLLAFLQGHNRLEAFWPRLTSPRPQERDDALQEIRVGRFLTLNGFPVVQWEPPGKGNFIGEFSVQALPSEPVFVEIKSPGWEGQLSQEQRDAGRAKQEKYQGLEGGADDPWRGIRMSVKKAYPKFLSTQPNLLVIADDRFMPLATWGRLAAEQALLMKNPALDNEAGYFTTTMFENLGGVALFKAEDEVLEGLQYTLSLYPNPMALGRTALPKRFVETFLKVRVAAAAL